VFVHEGKGAVWRTGEWVDVEPGTAVFVPGGEEHQFLNTGAAPLRFVCLVPRGSPEL
jgi:mannose-6-phosphate isomerase-like protein (cupin superfamily)